MSAPPRITRPGDTARELAEAREADFTAAVFLAGVDEAHQIGHAVANFGQRDRTGISQAWRRCRELQAEAEAAYRRKLAQWEADEPYRQAAQAAYERAMQRRHTGPVQVTNALDWAKPQPPAHLIGRI